MLNKRFILIVWLGVLTVALGVQTPTEAANFNAGTAAELIQAITDANTLAGADSVTLTADITLDAVNNTSNGSNGLPSITSTITIEGNGFGISRSTLAGTPNFRILRVFDGADDHLTLNHVTISNGRTTGGGFDEHGGAIFVDGGMLTTNNSTISGNVGERGGGVSVFFGTATLNNSTVASNEVTGDSVGGGVFANGATVTLTNSTVSGNFGASQGGGIYTYNSVVTLTNTTVVGNSAVFGGGIVVEHPSGTATLNSDNSVIAGNSAVLGQNCDQSFTTIILNGANNLSEAIADDGCPAALGDIVPGTDFSTTLADNGGPTQTHALLLTGGNPAVDGSGAGAPATDQRGVPAYATRDIGAYELQVVTLTANDPSALENPLDLGQFSVDLGAINEFGSAITVNYSVAGTATSGGDYTALTGSVDIPNGSQTATIDVTPLTDASLEGDETVEVTLTASNHASVGVDTTPATVTISDEGATATLNANDPAAAENPVDNGQFTVDLGVINNTGSVVTVSYSVAGTATSGSDYTALTGSVDILNGAQTATIDVVPLDDPDAEGAETVEVTLTGSSHPDVSVNGTPDTVTIEDNDTNLAIAATDAVKAEGNTGTTLFTFTVTRTGGLNQISSVDWNVMGSGANPADAADFGGSIPGGTVNFASGVSSQLVTISVAGDTTVENDEGFTVNLNNPVNTVIVTASAAGIIQNDDGATVTLTPVNAVQLEGDAGTTAYTFQATLNNPVAGGFTQPFSTNDGTATTADNDYVDNDGNLNFAGTANEQHLITIVVNGDTTVEAGENFSVNLGAPSNTGVVTSGAPQSGTIQNDDSATVTLTPISADQVEGDAGTTAFTFQATLNNPVAGGFTLPFSTNDGTATTAGAGNDYSDNDGNLNFVGTANEQQLITVMVNGDTTVEADETFSVSLGTPSITGIGTSGSPQNGTIRNDDSGMSVVAINASQAEGNSGTTLFSFTLTRSGDLSGTASVDWSVTGNGASPANAADFGGSFPSGTLVFAPGEASQLVEVPVTGDTEPELNEGFQIVLSNPVGVALGQGTEVGLIHNDDGGVPIPTLSQWLQGVLAAMLGLIALLGLRRKTGLV